MDRSEEFVNTLSQLYLSGDFEKLVSTSAAAISRFPSVSALHFWRGHGLFKLERLDEAAASFQQKLALDPDDAETQENLLICLRRLGRLEDMFKLNLGMFKARPSRPVGIGLLNVALAVPGREAVVDAMFRRFYSDTVEKMPGHDVSITAVMPLRAWCETHGAPMIEIAPEGQVTLRETANGEAVTYDPGPTWAAVVPCALGTCGWDYVIAPTGHILDGSGYMSIASAYNDFPHFACSLCDKAAFLWPRRMVEIDEDVLFLSSPVAFHFGHWLIDFLPRLLAWRLPGRPPLKLFCPRDLPQHHRDVLSMFGVGPHDLIEGESGVAYRFRSLTVFSMSDKYKPAPSVVTFLYQALALRKVPLDPAVVGRRVFLERSQTTRGRFIVNQDELNNVLREFGFETMRRPEVPITEQNRILAETGVVMGAYGSDMLALYQLPPGSDMIVFYVEDDFELAIGGPLDQFLTILCAILGMRLTRVPCAPVEEAGRIGYRRNITVDCTQLREILRGRTQPKLDLVRPA